MQDKTLKQLEKQAEAIRESIVEMVEHAGSGHIAGPLGMSDIMTALYFRIMRHDPKDPTWSERDIFLMSNGHCVPVQYATMAHAGYFAKKELLTLRQLGTRLQGHPEREALPGLENTSGPLGSGLSQACGIALSLKIDQNKNRTVYITVGDGELNEGQNWEAIMLAAKYNLDNIVAIVDRNNIQIDGPAEQVMPLESLKDKWESFNWHVQEIDGHNLEAIIDACAMARAVSGKPSVIIAHTIPGKGVHFMEGDFRWHSGAPTHPQAEEALRDLRSMRGKIIYD
ncbi:MAG: transketolase [Patescibacteria group bacterium]|nr:transketolase [Patescibacteria group bacterium]